MLCCAFPGYQPESQDRDYYPPTRQYTPDPHYGPTDEQYGTKPRDFGDVVQYKPDGDYSSEPVHVNPPERQYNSDRYYGPADEQYNPRQHYDFAEHHPEHSYSPEYHHSKQCKPIVCKLGFGVDAARLAAYLKGAHIVPTCEKCPTGTTSPGARVPSVRALAKWVLQ